MSSLFAGCVACAISLVYAEPIQMTLPQGAQTAVTIVDADGRPVALAITQTGSQAVAINSSNDVRGAALVTAVDPGFADVVLLPKVGEDEAVVPVALSVLVEPARLRREGDGPLTLKLTLPAIEGKPSMLPSDEGDAAVMVGGGDPPGWERGLRLVGSRPHVHWVRQMRERARVPTGWRLLFPVTASRKVAHGSGYRVWEAPAKLERWQWRDGNGREFYTGAFSLPPERRSDVDSASALVGVAPAREGGGPTQ